MSTPDAHPPVAEPADGPVGVAGALGGYVARTQAAALAPATAHAAVRALVDWTGVTLAGWRYPPAILLRDALAAELGAGPGELLGPAPAVCSPRNAALLNGTASHVVEMDDIYAPALYHPGSPTISAALAAAQAAGASGAQLLRAIVAGYEVGDRIGAAMQPAHYRYWHTTGTVGALGAAAAAAAALGLDAGRCAHALSLAATFAAGLQQAFRSDSMAKPLHAGRAAEAGVLAAQAAAAGLTGEAHMLEGPVGLGAAMSEGVDWAAAVAALAGPPTIEAMTVKDHACCGHAFAAIDGAMALRADAGAPDQIRRIRVETYTTAIEVAGVRRPATPFEAKFSIPFVVATALVHGRVRLEAFTPERVEAAGLQALAARVEMTASPTFDRAFPTLRGASVTIELADGRTLSHHQETRRGAPSLPISDAALFDKFLELAEPSIGGRAPALLARLRAMGEQPDARLRP